MLESSHDIIERRHQRELKTLEERKWRDISNLLAGKMPAKKYSAAACKERYEANKNGTALLPIELDNDQECRKLLRETRITKLRNDRANKIAESQRIARGEKTPGRGKEADETGQGQCLSRNSFVSAGQDNKERNRIAKERRRGKVYKKGVVKSIRAQLTAEFEWKKDEGHGREDDLPKLDWQSHARQTLRPAFQSR